MKSEFNEILLPAGSKVYNTETSTSVFIKTALLCGLIFGAGLAFYRYETKLQEMEYEVSSLTSKVIELEKHQEDKNVPIDDLSPKNEKRLKREVSDYPWVVRNAEGEPILNKRGDDYSTEEGLLSGRRRNRLRSGQRGLRRRIFTTTEEPIIRNHDDETFFTTDAQGRRFYPSGLKEMKDRLPPASTETMYTDRRHSPDVRTRSLPVRRMGQGRNRVSARVIDFDDDEPKKSESVVAHFVADISNFTSEDNPRLRNTDGVFQIWRPEAWNSKDALSYDKNDGTLTVLKSGIYYVYAQIHYHDENVEGFKLELNGNPLLQCTSKLETNSCFTAGLTKINENDKIVVKNIGDNIFSIFTREKSFFGLMRVAEVEM